MATIPGQLIAPHLTALEGADVMYGPDVKRNADIVRGAVVSTVCLSDATVITTITAYNGDISTSTESTNGVAVNLDAAFNALIKVHTQND